MTSSSSSTQRLTKNGVDFIYFKGQQAAPWHKLSNFAWARIDVDLALPGEEERLAPLVAVQPRLVEFIRATGSEKVAWPSSEHAWQSLKATTPQAFARFLCEPACETDSLARWNPDWIVAVARAKLGGPGYFDRLAARKGQKEADDKARETTAKATKEYNQALAKHNIGLYAKYAANAKYAAALNFAPGDMDYEREHLPADVERACWLAILRRKFTQNGDFRALLVEHTRVLPLIEFDKAGARKAVRAGTEPPPYWGACVVDGVVSGTNAMGKYLMALRDELWRQQEVEEEGNPHYY